MRLIFVVFVSTLALSAASQAAKKTAPRAKTAAKAAPKAVEAPKPAPGPPAGAVQDANGNYRYTDPQGKKWIYTKTPFGLTRREDVPEAAMAPVTESPIKAVEDGDIVRFERQTPFGATRWEKKKADLNEAEQAALENSRTNNTVSKQD